MKDLNPYLLQYRPGKHMSLKDDFDPDGDAGLDKEDSKKQLADNLIQLDELQNLLYADNRFGVLIILQGMDTAGKDGVIRKVMSGCNPQGCKVTSFKIPTPTEVEHDFLWRIHQAVPARGEIGIFNRSHYEDVLVAKVHHLPSYHKLRYEQINDFERGLAENGIEVLKFFLYISKEEQKKRLEERIADPAKNWKFSENDLKERKLWDDYQSAYLDMLERCTTPEAPWYVVPANKKWFRNLVVSHSLILPQRISKSQKDISVLC